MTQIVYSQGLSQELGFESLESADGKDDAAQFMAIVKELTGDWIHEIDCEEI